MAALREWMRRLWGTLRRNPRDRELEEELRAHLALASDDLQCQRSPEDAQRAARLQAGGVAQAMEALRDQRGLPWLDDLMCDVRHALRTLRRSPAFTAVALLTLALGIGANTAMFTVLNAVLLQPLPYPAPDRLVMLWTESQDLREGRSAYRDVEQWRAQSTSFVDMAVFDPVSLRLTAPGDVDRISVVRVSPGFFTLLGIQPVRGRLFSAEEAERRSRVALISHRFWQNRLGGTENVVGTRIELDGAPSEVVGVLAADVRFPGADADVWEPHTMFPDWETRRNQASGSWFVLGRLRSGVTLEQARTELNAVARRLYPAAAAVEPGRGAGIEPLSLHLVGARLRLALWMLTGAVSFVLLIAVTNIASLSLCRVVGRGREIGLRSALGASPARVMRQLFTESLTLAVLAGLVGIAVAWASLRFVVALTPAGLLLPQGIDWRTLAWTMSISLLTGILVGVMPAVAAGRSNLGSALSEAGKGSSAGSSARRVRRTLVVAELALALMLLAGAGLLIRSLINVQRVAWGFSAERVLSMQLALPESESSSQRTGFYRQVLEQVEAVGSVEAAAVIGDLVVGGVAEQTITIEGGARAISRRLPLRRDEVSDGWLSTLRVPLRRGRSFSSDDGPDAPRVATVNETMARQLWPGQDPVMKRFKFGPPASDGPWFTVVGIAGDMRRQGPEDAPVAQMFEPLAQNPSRLATLLVRTSIDPVSMAATLRGVVRRIDRRVPTYGIATLNDRLLAFQTERRVQTSLLAAFSIAALLLAAVGIYGLIHYSIATRTREIGIRMAVGAERRDIVAMIVREGLGLSLVGVTVGLAGAVWLGRAGSSLLFGVTATDPATYLAVSLLLTAVALAGCYFPARRAARLDPLVALKCE